MEVRSAWLANGEGGRRDGYHRPKRSLLIASLSKDRDGAGRGGDGWGRGRGRERGEEHGEDMDRDRKPVILLVVE